MPKKVAHQNVGHIVVDEGHGYTKYYYSNIYQIASPIQDGYIPRISAKFRESKPGGNNDTRLQDCQHSRQRPGSSAEVLYRENGIQGSNRSSLWARAAMD